MRTRKSWLVATAFAFAAGATMTSPVQAQDDVSTTDAEVAPVAGAPASDDLAVDNFVTDELAATLSPTEIAAAKPGGGGATEPYLEQDGYVWHSNGSADATYPGDGSSTWRYNPTGEDIVVDRYAIGRYSVGFSTSLHNFIPTVTSYNSVGNFCSILSYAYPGNYVNVDCYDPAGNRVDEEFTVRWTMTDEDGYTWVSSTGTTFAWNNPWGGQPTVTKASTGTYQVTFPGAAADFENGLLMATAYFDEYCTIAGWGGDFVNVRCFDVSGVLTDASFTLLWIGSNDDAHAWANNASSTTAYDVSSTYSHNPQGTNPTSVKTSTGRYTVTFPGLEVAYGGSVAVTAYGTSGVKCNVTGWGTTIAFVSCTNASGVATDSQFDILFTRFQVCEGVPANIEIGNDDPTSGDDVIAGTDGDDTIYALGGNDLVCGFSGNDFISGAAGNDVIYGGPGDDFMSGNAGNDVIYGEDGHDTAYSGSGADSLYGGPGDDTLGGSSGADVIYGEAGNDVLSGGSDADGMIQGGDGDDAVNGGSGDDTQVEGNAGNDTVSGNGGNDSITGNTGNDEVRGGPGNDDVYGGAGNDFVAGNDGVDYCDGEAGTDTAASNCETIVGVP